MDRQTEIDLMEELLALKAQNSAYLAAATAAHVRLIQKVAARTTFLVSAMARPATMMARWAASL